MGAAVWDSIMDECWKQEGRYKSKPLLYRIFMVMKNGGMGTLRQGDPFTYPVSPRGE